MKTITTVTRQFEVGDLFIFTGKPVSGDAYTKGDFLLIKEVTCRGIKFTTADSIAGERYELDEGDNAYLCRELDAGALEYQGNVKVGA